MDMNGARHELDEVFLRDKSNFLNLVLVIENVVEAKKDDGRMSAAARLVRPGARLHCSLVCLG
jgi:hypothetical protein